MLDDLFDLPPLTKFAGQVLAAGIVVALGRPDAVDPAARSDRLAGRRRLGRHHRVLHRALLQRGQLRRRSGRAGHRGGRHRRLRVLRLLLPAHRHPGPDPGDHLEPDHGGDRRSLPGLPAAQLLPGPDVHGRLGRDAAGPAAGHARRSA